MEMDPLPVCLALNTGHEFMPRTRTTESPSFSIDVSCRDLTVTRLILPLKLRGSSDIESFPFVVRSNVRASTSSFEPVNVITPLESLLHT